MEKDINGERRERELMRSNSERDRSVNSQPRELLRDDDQREISLAKYSCRGEVGSPCKIHCKLLLDNIAKLLVFCQFLLVMKILS